MSEITLQNKNTELKDQLQEASKKEKISSKLVKELNLKLAQTEIDNTNSRAEYGDRLKKEHNEKLQKIKTQLKSKEMDFKVLDIKCASLTRTIACLSTKFDTQRLELEKAKEKLAASELAYTESLKSCLFQRQRATEMTKEVAVANARYEEVQKSLLTEKKMSRFFIKERDQLLEEQDARYREASKDLEKVNRTVKTLTAALNLKIAECKSQKEISKGTIATHQRKCMELQCRVDELEKKELELSKKTCEYCGF